MTQARNYAVYILGAGFSRPAGLPLANELWQEVRRRAEAMHGRAEKFGRDLDSYIQFVADCDGIQLDRDTVNFEKFLSYLDVEFHLGLRGGDTWSDAGNETQVIVKTLIGQILTEMTPKVLPQLYLDFARKLKPGDTVLTFNYDLLLERSLEQVGTPYRLFPDRFKEVFSDGSGTTDLRRELDEVLVLKLHGSLDWFSKKHYRAGEQEFRKLGALGSPSDPIFNPSQNIAIKPLLDGPRPQDDPLKDVYRVVDVESVYYKPAFFLQTPVLISPSTSKLLWFGPFKSFWWGMHQLGILNRRLNIIGFSLAEHDDYARQVLYSIVKNFQELHWGLEELGMGKKTSMLIVDFQTSPEKEEQFRKRYAFVDWSKAELQLGGFSSDVVASI